MQYKIPVQIENEDPIFLWLSLKQLIILIVAWAISYSIFKWLTNSWIPPEVASILPIFIFLVALVIVLFKHSWMTFIPFILNLIRVNINSEAKIWSKWVDSFAPIDIWYVAKEETKKQEKIDIKSKQEKLKELQKKLNKI